MQDNAGLWEVPRTSLTPFPHRDLQTPCEFGDGLAVCAPLRLLVTASSLSNTVSLWRLPCTLLGLSVECTCVSAVSGWEPGQGSPQPSRTTSGGFAHRPRPPCQGTQWRDPRTQACSTSSADELHTAA